MTNEDVGLALGAAAVIGIALLVLIGVVIAVALVRMSREVRRTTATAQSVLDVVNTELPPTLKDLRTTAAQLARLVGELPPRIERIDGLLDEVEASAQSLRATAEAAEDIVRGPAAAMDRAARTVSAVGTGLARGADRLRRSVQERSGRS